MQLLLMNDCMLYSRVVVGWLVGCISLHLPVDLQVTLQSFHRCEVLTTASSGMREATAHDWLDQAVLVWDWGSCMGSAWAVLLLLSQ